MCSSVLLKAYEPLNIGTSNLHASSVNFSEVNSHILNFALSFPNYEYFDERTEEVFNVRIEIQVSLSTIRHIKVG